MHFEGSEPFSQPAPQLYAFLGDVGRVAATLKDADDLLPEADRASWNVRPRFAFLAGTLQTLAEIQLRQPPDELGYLITSRGVGCHSSMRIRLRVSPRGPVLTQIDWTADLVELTGILRMVPRPMLQLAVLQVINDVWQSIRHHLPPPEPNPSEPSE